MLNFLTNELKICKDAYTIFISDLITKRQKSKVSNFLREAYLIQTAKSLVEIAWKELGRNPAKLSLEKETVKIPIKKEYIERVKSPEVKKIHQGPHQRFLLSPKNRYSCAY